MVDPTKTVTLAAPKDPLTELVRILTEQKRQGLAVTDLAGALDLAARAATERAAIVNDLEVTRSHELGRLEERDAAIMQRDALRAQVGRLNLKLDSACPVRCPKCGTTAPVLAGEACAECLKKERDAAQAEAMSLDAQFGEEQRQANLLRIDTKKLRADVAVAKADHARDLQRLSAELAVAGARVVEMERGDRTITSNVSLRVQAAPEQIPAMIERLKNLPTSGPIMLGLDEVRSTHVELRKRIASLRDLIRTTTKKDMRFMKSLIDSRLADLERLATVQVGKPEEVR